MTDSVDENAAPEKASAAKALSDAGEIPHESQGSPLPSALDFSTPDDARYVTARGTEDGLVLRIDGRAEWSAILGELEQFLGGRKKFFEGGEVSVEWLDRLPTKEQSSDLEEFLKIQYGLEIANRGKKGLRAKQELASQAKRMGVTIPLFEEIAGADSTKPLNRRIEVLNTATPEKSERAMPTSDELFAEVVASLGHSVGESPSPSMARKSVGNIARTLGEDAFFDDDANAKMVFATLRSGQRIETPFSLIVVGDVNPGADLVAGGDILVVGSLRGTAHAGAYDDDCFDRFIIALQMQPMQLRIGSVISRGSDDKVAGVEIARIDNRRIVVEAFNPRASLRRGRT